jgi:pyruvate ferredoxin oxidoreductase alpha subunit
MAYKMLDGNSAAVEAMKLAKVQVISAYPITPQSSISEKLADLVADGTLNAEYIRVESEHTAMSAATTAGLVGVRAATATASNGLALMSEVLGMTAGNRVPIVMPVVNRGVAAPWTLWCEHGDAMSQRDLGWLQFYCQNVQEVLDMTLVAYRISEDYRGQLPSMVCLDGFFLSHSMQKIDVPDQAAIDEYVGPYIPKNTYLDTSDPMFICDLTSPDEYTEMRYQQKIAMENVLDVFNEAAGEYEKITGRTLKMVEGYKLEDAEVALVAMGSMAGTTKQVVNQLRAQGKKVGMMKLVAFRPFPAQQIRDLLSEIPVIGVFDRSAGLGSQGGPAWNEVSAVLKDCPVDIRQFAGGLGGRDVTEKTVTTIYEQLLAISAGEEKSHTHWIDVKDNAMTIREVMKNVGN